MTGTPCSGTMYVAELLTSAGLPTSHEHRLKGEVVESVFPGESSAFAPLHFEWLLRSRSVRRPTVIHLVRPPLNTIACMMTKKVLEADGLREWAEENGVPSTLDGYGEFWVHWNYGIMLAADLQWRVDRIRPADIVDLARTLKWEGPVKARQAVEKTDPMNSSRTRLRLSPSDFSPRMWERITAICRSLGLPTKKGAFV